MENNCVSHSACSRPEDVFQCVFVCVCDIFCVPVCSCILVSVCPRLVCSSLRVHPGPRICPPPAWGPLLQPAWPLPLWSCSLLPAPSSAPGCCVWSGV